MHVFSQPILKCSSVLQYVLHLGKLMPMAVLPDKIKDPQLHLNFRLKQIVLVKVCSKYWMGHTHTKNDCFSEIQMELGVTVFFKMKFLF